MIKLMLITIVSMIAVSSVFAQKTENANPVGAREAMIKFIELNNKQLLQTDEARLLLSGDASGWKDNWFGQILSQPDKIVVRGKNFAVAKVQLVEKNSRVVDLYFYLEHKESWTIYTMRAMAQTGWLESIKTGLSGKTRLTTEEKEWLANVELTLSSDKILTEWFQKNRLAFDKLLSLALLETKPKPQKIILPPKIKNRRSNKGNGNGYGVAVNEAKEDLENYETSSVKTITQYTKIFPKTAAALKNLHLSALDIKHSSNVEITIGGVTDNSVGFLYSPSDKPPEIDGWRYIWIEKIAPRWYLFRTT